MSLLRAREEALAQLRSFGMSTEGQSSVRGVLRAMPELLEVWLMIREMESACALPSISVDELECVLSGQPCTMEPSSDFAQQEHDLAARTPGGLFRALLRRLRVLRRLMRCLKSKG